MMTNKTENTVTLGRWQFSMEYGITNSQLEKELLLEPRLSRLIYFLGLNANSYVSREYLIEHIWEDAIVNEDSLTRAIADLRKILTANFKDAIVIETLRKRGYRLSLKPNKFKLRINPSISNLILGFIMFIILIWMLADFIGIVETKFINSRP